MERARPHRQRAKSGAVAPTSATSRHIRPVFGAEVEVRIDADGVPCTLSVDYFGQRIGVSWSRQTGPFKNIAPSNFANTGTSPAMNQ